MPRKPMIERASPLVLDYQAVCLAIEEAAHAERSALEARLTVSAWIAFAGRVHLNAAARVDAAPPPPGGQPRAAARANSMGPPFVSRSGFLCGSHLGRSPVANAGPSREEIFFGGGDGVVAASPAVNREGRVRFPTSPQRRGRS